MDFEAGIPMTRGASVTEGPSLAPSLNQGFYILTIDFVYFSFVYDIGDFFENLNAILHVNFVPGESIVL